MAIVIRGKTKCSICEKTIEEGQEIIAFPSFTSDSNDPLLLFSDSAFHKLCFENHSLAKEAIDRLSKILGPLESGKTCWICKKQIVDPDDYICFSLLTYNPNNPLFFYNNAQFHLNCLRDSSNLPVIIKELENHQRYRSSGDLDVSWLIKELKFFCNI